ncbi:MAG: hypothetical protein ACI92W_000686, partial [Paraglaciecola sp.]
GELSCSGGQINEFQRNRFLWIGTYLSFCQFIKRGRREGYLIGYGMMEALR